MSPSNLARYEAYFQFNDPITPTLARRRGATAVSAVMAHERLKKTEFFCDFLQKDGLCYGLNFFARDQGRQLGDLRIWRSSGHEDFGEREIALVNAIGPSFVNALARAKAQGCGRPLRQFCHRRHTWGLTAREAEVADLLLTGLRDRQVCDTLSISKPTLRTHIAAIFQKLGVKNRASLHLKL